MSDFTAGLCLEQCRSDVDDDGQLEPSDHWKTLRAITYHAGSEDSAEAYTVPEGFITDGASIPRFLWGVVGHPLDTFAEAAVLHDYLYRTACVPRARADDLLLEAMAVLDIGWLTRYTIYWAVRWFGWAAWEANRKEQDT